jgi:hypothetical protein
MTEEQAFQHWFVNEWHFGSSTDEAKARRAWVKARSIVIDSGPLHELRIDMKRITKSVWTVPAILVRAKNEHGHFQTCDISDLDRESLLTWLRSRGGSNALAEATVLILLGHEQELPAGQTGGGPNE